MRGLLFTIAILAFVGMIIVSTIQWYDFKSNCDDYLKLAGDAPTIEKANEFLGTAIDYLERNRMTEGNSAFFLHSPKNDVGIWYRQVKGAHETTANLIDRKGRDPMSVSQLEQDNALMKIRETVLDAGESGVHTTKPDNITVYPGQGSFLFAWIFTSLFLVISGIVWFRSLMC